MQQTIVTCMSTLHKDSELPRSICALVVGTEHNQVLLMEPSSTAIVRRIDLPSTPVFMAVQVCIPQFQLFEFVRVRTIEHDNSDI